MEEQPHSFDICIICALHEEARAVINEWSSRCNVSFTKAFRSLNHQEYRYATIQNRCGEPLTIFVTWLSDMGLIRTGLDLAPLLLEIRPRFAAMTGVCAGDRKKVRLGDLIVPTEAYHPEEGKITMGSDGQPVHLPETRTTGATAQVIQYVRGFDEWREPVRELKRLQLNRAWRRTDEPQCHIEVMASSMAVRADNPFPQFEQQHHRKTVGVDMEAATFYTALRDFPYMHGLVVKGVSDYGDSTKNDRSRDYAMRASAAYLLYFIQQYVTEETMPRRDARPSEGRVEPSGIWLVPYRRNPFFTGREVLLKHLYDRFTIDTAVGLAQGQAISGLGGIGKTQVAIEYAYRHKQEYRYVLWANAATHETLIADFMTIADRLQLPEHAASEQEKIVAAVIHWLEAHDGWLLVFDNADDLNLASTFLPKGSTGHLLLTTREQAVGDFGSFVLERLALDEGTLLLLRRTHLLKPQDLLEQASPAILQIAEQIVQVMDGLPLALDQAGAYIEETQCGLAAYLKRYYTLRSDLLDRRGRSSRDHPLSVATTWSLSFERIEHKNPAAAELMRLCAFLYPDAIPEELITAGVASLGVLLESLAADAGLLDEAISTLRAYSLAKRDPSTSMLYIHRLVQAVLQDAMAEQEQLLWQQRAVHAVNALFPDATHQERKQCERLLPHALLCATFALDRTHDQELVALLEKTADYLYDNAQYAEAEQLYQRALRILEQALGPEKLMLAYPLNGLANLYFQWGKYEQAEQLYQRALEIREQTLGPEHPDVATSLNNLANLYFQRGKYEQTEPLLQQALLIQEQMLGPEHPKVAYPLTVLANLYFQQGKFEQAEQLYQRALGIREQTLGPEHPEVGSLLSNLANLYFQQGKFEQTGPLLQRALLIQEQALGAEHPDIAYSLSGLANLYREQGKYEQAEQLYQRALKIREQVLGAGHPDVAYPLNDLANLYREQGKYEQAEPLYERALAIRKGQLGMQHPDTAESLHDMGRFAQVQHQMAKALSRYQQALRLREQVLGRQHPETVKTRTAYADLLRKMGHTDEADALEAHVSD